MSCLGIPAEKWLNHAHGLVSWLFWNWHAPSFDGISDRDQEPILERIEPTVGMMPRVLTLLVGIVDQVLASHLEIGANALAPGLQCYKMQTSR